MYPNLGVGNVAHALQSDALSDPVECMSEESVSMKPGTSSPILKTILTSEQNSSFLGDGSMEESTPMVPEVPSSFDENAISIDDDVPWACSDGSSECSVVMELESPPSALESMVAEVSSGESPVTPREMISLVAGELTNQVKQSSDRSRSMKQEIMRKSMASSIAGSLKDAASMKRKEQKQLNGLKVDEKQKREPLRSSLPVKTSLLARVKDKKKVDPAEKSSTLNRTVKSIKRIHAGAMPDKGPCTSSSPIIIKERTLSPPKRMQLSPKPLLLLKNNSSVVKCSSPMSDSGRIAGQVSQERSQIAWKAGMSKMGDEKILKQIAESQAPKSTASYAPGLNNRKLRSAQNLIDVAQKSTEQKQMQLRSQLSLRTSSARSSISSSAFLSSSYESESDGSRSTIRNASGSRKTHIGERIGRTPVHLVEQKLGGVALKSAEQKHTKLRSSRSLMSSSAFVSSGYEEENDGSGLMISNLSGSKKTHIGERRETTLLHVVEQKLSGVALISAEQKNRKLRSQLSSRTLSSRSSTSSSTFVSSNYEEESDESLLTISDAKGNGRTPLYPQKSDYKEILKQTENITLEDKSWSLNTMSFGRGNESSPQRVIPDQRRLGLIREKAASEAENFDGVTGMSSFNESRESATACSGTVSPISPTVVSRHQDVQEKNVQVLSNEVIEETANKMVEIKKNKVKALVSAFESIISLQQKTV